MVILIIVIQNLVLTSTHQQAIGTHVCLSPLGCCNWVQQTMTS